MPLTLPLLQQVRAAIGAVRDETDDANHKVQLSIVDMYLNELMLQDDTAFYRAHLAHGQALLGEGLALARRLGAALADPPAIAAVREDARIEAINARIDALNAALVSVVQALEESRSAAEKDFLLRLTAWESSLYLRRLEQVPAPARAERREITAPALEDYLREKFPGWTDLRVTRLQTLEGGISKKTILFDVEDAVHGTRSLVLRAEQPSKLLHFRGCDVDREFYIIALMHKLGMPVPAALWLEEDADRLGARFLVTEKAEGSNWFAGLATLRDDEKPPQHVVDSLMQTLYRMHALQPEADDPLVLKSHLAEWMPHRTVRDIALYNARVALPELVARAGIAMSPQLVRGIRWLERNAPDCDDPPVVVHVDFAFNNILFRDGRVSAVLDWETSRMGDPADDIQWTQKALGVYSMPEFLAHYERATGRRVSEYRLAYARVQLCVVSIAHGLVALHALDADAHAPLHSGVMALKYMPLFSGNLGELIAQAEAVRDR